MSWAWCNRPLTWLTNYMYFPSVLWHCWLGRLTRKIVPEMTWNVSTGTLNRAAVQLRRCLSCLILLPPEAEAISLFSPQIISQFTGLLMYCIAALIGCHAEIADHIIGITDYCMRGWKWWLYVRYSRQFSVIVIICILSGGWLASSCSCSSDATDAISFIALAVWRTELKKLKN